MGKKATGRHKAYYEQQKVVTAKHKREGLAKRKKKLDAWIAKGINKKGKKVLTLDERKLRAANRKVVRDEKRVAERKRRRLADQAWEAEQFKRSGNRNKFHRKPRPIEEE